MPGLNILLILADTLRPDYCGCYGNTWVKTPTIDALAAKAHVFTRFYCASFPTRPMRKDLHSGRFTFTYTRWPGEWSHNEVVLAEVLQGQGYRTALIGDTPSNGGFERGFHHFEIIKGQGPVPINPNAPDQPLPADERKLRTPIARLQAILKNRLLWRGEEDHYVAQTMRAAHRWLETCAGKPEPFFLFVDTFDPHEPWDPPRYYVDRYDPNYKGNELFEPAYEPADYATPEEIAHMRCLYAAEVTLVDRWIGYLLQGLAQMGLYDSTIIILTSDHGFYHGEHNLIGKVQLERDGVISRRWPCYDTIARAPLLIKLPRSTQHRIINAFCQPPDLMPTILDLVGAPIPSTVQGISLKRLMKGKAPKVRDAAITSYTYLQDAEVRCPTAFRTTDYLYIYGGDEWESELYDLRKDPQERRNILPRHKQVAQAMHERYLRFLEQIQCPRERIEGRREFCPKPRSPLPRMRWL